MTGKRQINDRFKEICRIIGRWGFCFSFMVHSHAPATINSSFQIKHRPSRKCSTALAIMALLALMCSYSKSIVFSLPISSSFPCKHAVRIAWTFKEWVTVQHGNPPGTVCVAEKSGWSSFPGLYIAANIVHSLGVRYEWCFNLVHTCLCYHWVQVYTWWTCEMTP